MPRSGTEQVLPRLKWFARCDQQELILEEDKRKIVGDSVGSCNRDKCVDE